MDLSLFVQILANAVMASLTLILIALGVTLIFGLMRIVNFFHGEVYALGGLSCWFFSSKVLVDLGGSQVLSFVGAVVISAVMVAILGIIIERLFLRRWHDNLLVSLIVSLAFILIMQTGMLAFFGFQNKKALDPFPGVFQFAGVMLPQSRVVVILSTIVLILGLYFFIQRTRAGRAMRAIEQDREAAALYGVNYSRTCSLGMGIGCGLAATAGSLLAIVFALNPWSGGFTVIKAYSAVILGGMGSLGGTVIASFVIGFIESFGGSLLGSDIALLLIFGSVMVILVVRPKGLFGRA